ncbi:MAG: PEP-CTERM sorting domain-containing protein, partial [Armatimonadota bacterium]
NSSEDTWTDWHVCIQNGTNLRDIRVYKVGEGTLWPYELLPNACGFFAHVITSGNPQNPMAVEPGATLHVEFVYDVAGSPVTVTQYPTDWHAIPEPSSMAALLIGVYALGFGAFRMRRR